VASREAQLAGNQRILSQALLLEQLTQQLQSRNLLASADEYSQDLALTVNSSPQLRLPTLKSHRHVIQVPSPRRFEAQRTQIAGESRPKLQNLLPDRLIGDTEPPRQRIPRRCGS
jgi:hypothetical protein